MNITPQIDPEKELSKRVLTITFFAIVFIIIAVILNGCTSEKKIQERIKEGIRIDREINKCANDTIYRLVPGEQLILTDTVTKKTIDSFFNLSYDTTYITKTIRKVDTIKAFIRDDYKINSLNDSINVHKQAESNLQGQIYQEKLLTIEAEKKAKNRLIILISLVSLIAISFGVGTYLKLSVKKLLPLVLLISFSSQAQVVHKYYTIYYDTLNKGPEHTEYWLTKAKLNHVAKRPNKFTNDPLVAAEIQSSNYTYKNSGYDKGHLSPNDDFRFDEQANVESMYLTNVAPQNRKFNQGIWEHLEAYVRSLALKFDSVKVETGVIYGKEKLKSVGIPIYYWKRISYNGATEYYIGENTTPASNDFRTMKK